MRFSFAIVVTGLLVLEAQSGFTQNNPGECEDGCFNDDNNNGVCDAEEIQGCTYADAVNYNELATLDNGSCLFLCNADLNGNGAVGVDDMLILLNDYGTACPGEGCMDPDACNYDPEAVFDLGFCEYPEPLYDCEGNCLYDPNEDGICDIPPSEGCTDPDACNYNPDAITDDGSCEFPLTYYDCEGNCLSDADNDGTCDELEVFGCTNPLALNYDADATEDDGSCEFPPMDFTCLADSAFSEVIPYGSAVDIDGNVYRTVIIGEQEWFAENLRSEHFANGEEIPAVPYYLDWYYLYTSGWCYFGGSEVNNCPHGKLYNWYAASDERNVCPSGWHVPGDDDWTVLSEYLGGEAVAGGKLKTEDDAYWWAPNTGATNETGFSALPSGYRFYVGIFYSMGEVVYWWSSTEGDTTSAWLRGIEYNEEELQRQNYHKGLGFSIRCVRD